jgi:hypothetical protein
MRLLLLSLLIVLSGCSSNPWAYNAPPVAKSLGVESAQKPVILLKNITLGTGIDTRWDGLAGEMQKSLSRALLKSGNFFVVSDRAIALEATTAFYVEVKITDFLHTSEAPESTRRLSWFSEANDAIVAFDITATEVRTGRVVLSDQIAAIVSAGDAETDQYGNLEFGSYLFWSTPLGNASAEVISDTVVQLAELRGTTPGSVTITHFTSGNRNVSLQGGDLLAGGNIYFVGIQDQATGSFVTVEDDLGRPLRVRVEHHFWSKSTGWLLSEPSEHAMILGATLSTSPLPAATKYASETN